jgi:ABC-type transport system involved in multi-copper enzyme maturation permease subunit
MFYMFMLMLFLFTFSPLITDNISILSDLGKIVRNSPYVIFERLIFSSLIGALFVVILVASSVVRDYEDQIAELVFTTSLKKEEYIFGRFLGSVTAALILFLAPVTAILLIGFLRTDLIGEIYYTAYLRIFISFIIPNVLFIGGLTFMLATLSKKMLNAYIGLFAFFMFYLLANTLSGSSVIDNTNQLIAYLSDPFGLTSFYKTTMSWSVHEKSILMIPFSDEIILNRILWAGVGLISLLTTYYFFSFEMKTSKKDSKLKENSTKKELTFSASKLIFVNPIFNINLDFKHYLIISKIEVFSLIKNKAFWIVCTIFIINLLNTLFFALDEELTAPTYAYTGLVVNLWDSNVFVGAFILITIFSGEIIWKERQNGLDTIFDSLPFSNSTLYLGKFTALLFMLVIYLALVFISSVIFQIFSGFYELELALMLKTLVFKHFITYSLWLIMGVFIQKLAPNKYIGFFLMFLFFSLLMYTIFNTDNYLFSYASLMNTEYSDMAGYDVYLQSLMYHQIYWAAFGLFLGVISLLFWRRGIKISLKEKLIQVKSRFNRNYLIAFGTALTLFVLSASFIYQEAYTKSDSLSRSEKDFRAAEYELKYKNRAGKQAKITDIDLKADFYPSQRKLEIAGTYILKNGNTSPIDSIHITCRANEFAEFDIEGKKAVYKDKKLGYYIFALDKPLLPNATIKFNFKTSHQKHLIEYNNDNTNLVENGMTFSNLFENAGIYTPKIGYEKEFELDDEQKRKDYNLPNSTLEERVAELDDKNLSLVSSDADWINFNAVVSTQNNQKIAGTGKLEKEWTKNNRNYYQYRSELPMQNAYKFISAAYKIKKTKWEDVEIVVYYHPQHDENIDYILKFAKKSLDYCSNAYGKYPYSQMRIAEATGYRLQGQSYPNLLTISADFGFKYDLRAIDLNKIEYLSWVVSHELVHQWWINQITPAKIPGAVLMTEAIADYTTLQIMEDYYGEYYKGKILTNRRNEYFRVAGDVVHKETSLLKNLDQILIDQMYLGYYKNSIVVNAVSEYVGKDSLNSVLKDFFDKYKFTSSPYPDPNILAISYIGKTLPDSLSYLLNDLFYKITVFDNKISDVNLVKKDKQEEYKLSVSMDFNKFYIDDKGIKNKAKLNEYVELFVYDIDDEIIEKRTLLISENKYEIELFLDKKPSKIELDPKILLMDKSQEDNVFILK